MNPLRPYYIPPSIGGPPDPIPTPGPNPFPQGSATGKYASKAREIFRDIDYKDYISEPSPSLVTSVKDLVDELLWKYTSVLMAQPFEVAKTILQVHSQDDTGGPSAAEPERLRLRPSSYRSSTYEQVRLLSWPLAQRLISGRRTVPIPTRTSHPTSHPMLQTHRRLPTHARDLRGSRRPWDLLVGHQNSRCRDTGSISRDPTPSSRLYRSCGRKNRSGESGRVPTRLSSTLCSSH